MSKETNGVEIGFWVTEYENGLPLVMHCSKCNARYLKPDVEYDYCPHCGARMGGGDGKNDI